MSQKAEKPSLSGTRLKTRKRDEKEKYDPSLFRDAIIAGLNETDGDLDLVSKYLDTAGAKLDYRRYADVLFDILVAGGQLAPGGSIVEDPDPNKLSKTHVCVFGTEESIDKLKAFYDIFYKLLRRYKYLEKSFEETLKKLILFLKGYHESDQRKLAIITGVFLATGFCSAKVLSNLFEDHLVKDGLSLDFATMMFRVWLEERDIQSINGALKKAQLDTRLLELFPLNKRSLENFVVHFEKARLSPIADMQKAISTSGIRKNLQKQLGEMIKDEESVEEMLRFIQEQIKDNSLNDSEITTMVWNTIMAAVAVGKR
ncbi:Basic leucine zipper and W2 domain-containing protein 1,Protein krasavietz,Basic leucine zipper and W2 domain-containing protein 1-A,Basic leucine zipper and W2 domain-containing protein 2,Basic leucine zipper and W2 domain-containing protein 1-B [Mytilus edulis]|uniref:5MP1/2-like HEAT domain-containing protein n=1 Tax=Mytilus edulis TaxID=6550 RepID=A0A8S3RS40_MYTED|nr:Basic leucine zipper and W2 domain-containing protein 1,Protein krasavietz,Basic leucine zipper and W2 domain-containing protein 1-A,Basic leucine zipper and W2 domain-containing protein 2,Basic leucine zipper and W2 domain-containing protein 1-B [Mytilus edulis]